MRACLPAFLLFAIMTAFTSGLLWLARRRGYLPGRRIGFGKGLADNLALLNNLAMFHGLGVPLIELERRIATLEG